MNQTQENLRIPRILLAAPKSGSGKTLLTCALLQHLKQDGKNVKAFKCGPDYIDPMFHRTVLGVDSENLDTWFSGEAGTRSAFAEAAEGAQIAVMEGVMGLYDGLGGVQEEGSAYHLAKVTKTPILLVADARGMGRSVLPMLKGFLDYDTEGLIRGILLNRMTEGLFQTLRPLFERELSVPVIGYFPNRKDIRIESRHLGLMLPEEITDLRRHLKNAAAQLQETGNIGEILRIAVEAEALPVPKKETEEKTAGSAGETDGSPTDRRKQPVLAVARDAAFCFYYAANLRLLEQLGAKIRYFSPLADARLPEDADGILLGGGYPELYARQLSKNESMRASVRAAIAGGMPSLAECGGFLYLHETLEDMEGRPWPMAGVIPAAAANTGKLSRFGYVELHEKAPCFLPEGSKIKAHEFHYYDSTDNGNACTAVKPVSGKSWECVQEGANRFWGFAHLYYPSAPAFAAHFVSEMQRFSQRDPQAGYRNPR